MRLDAVKSEEQQALLMLHNSRDLLVRQRPMLINALRAHLGHYGIVKAQRPTGMNALLAMVQEAQAAILAHALSAPHIIMTQFRALVQEIERLERLMLDWRYRYEASRRLSTIPCIGPIIGRQPWLLLFRML
jgi:transposase